jgi:hypothetical protein
MLNSNTKPKSSFLSSLLIALIGAALGAGISHYLTRNYSAPNKEEQALVELQKQQLAATQIGFNSLATILSNNQQTDPVIINNVNSIQLNLKNLAATTNNLSVQNKTNSTPLDTTYKPIIVKDRKPDPQPIEHTPVGSLNEIKIKIGDSNLATIDEVNHISVIKESELTGNIAVVVNGSQTSMGFGTKRNLKDAAGKDFELYYKGKEDGNYVFLILKK